MSVEYDFPEYERPKIVLVPQVKCRGGKVIPTKDEPRTLRNLPMALMDGQILASILGKFCDKECQDGCQAILTSPAEVERRMF